MTSSKGASQYNKFNWEESEFPIVCEVCFGSNPFMRMTKDRYGKECGVCTRPFTVFRWQTNTEGKFQSTDICQVCARTKNVCQSCIMDLEYGVPVQLRDKYLNIEQHLPKGPVSVEYQHQLAEKEMSLHVEPGSPYKDFKAPGRATNTTIRMLAQLARSEPYTRNKANICTFFIKGECHRGEECPYRHEVPQETIDPVNPQHIKDRYYGVDDNIAQRIIEKYDALPTLTHPEDRTVTTIEVHGLPLEYTEADTRGYLSQFGEVRFAARGPGTAWTVQFVSRQAAEKAAQALFDWHQLGYTISVQWSVGCSLDSIKAAVAPPLPAVPGLSSKPKLLPPLPQPKKISQAPPVVTDAFYYPSQDPERLGNKPI